MTAAVAGPRRFRPGLKAMANSAGILVLVVAAAIFPLSAAAHEGMLSNASQVVVFLPIAGVGLVIARRLPRNPIGWLLLAGAAGPLLSAAADPYVQLVYRLGHRWPLGPLALVLAESWVAVYLTLPLVILLFPDGTLPSPLADGAVGVPGRCLVPGAGREPTRLRPPRAGGSADLSPGRSGFRLARSTRRR